jgi:Gnt-I system high-affinity gluconate transporter
MSILIVLICIGLLVLMITWGKITPFLAFLITSIVAGLLLGIPIEKIPGSLEKGIGGTIGSLLAIVSMGAMFGKLVSESGAAQCITAVLMKTFGERYIQWALMVSGFIIGIPLFYNVGFVLLVPMVISVSYRYKVPAVYIGIPLLASLSVTHGFLPPHPSPSALVPQFGASMSKTLIYGFIIAIPAVILGGPVFARTLKNIRSLPLDVFKPKEIPEAQLPSAANSFLSALLPVLLLAFSTTFPFWAGDNRELKNIFSFLGDPTIVMLIALLIGTYTLGIALGATVKDLMGKYVDAVKDISFILLIVAGAGTLKQIFVDSGVSATIGEMLKSLPLNPLLLGWLIATIIRVCLGSATVAGLTTAGIIAPVVLAGGVDPNLMILAVGAGSLMFSHVNDAGFWLFKEYFNLSLKDTLRSWSVMETIVGTVGLIGVLILDQLL